MILIKYLEDRNVFPRTLFGRFHPGARSFLDILAVGRLDAVRRFLAYLEKKFNGDVFTLGENPDMLTEAELCHFTTLVEGKTLGRQRHFWALYNFEHIPVEVISRLYQRFVTGSGAVYTPPFLADLLLDQAMPFNRLTGKEKILDPSCGSGVFLVGAFKRMVTHWRMQNNWAEPSATDLNHSRPIGWT